MGKYFIPLGIFILGNGVLLIAFLFMLAIGTAADTLAANTTEMASTFWLWTWAVGGTKLWVFLGLELGVLFATAKAFLAIK